MLLWVWFRANLEKIFVAWWEICNVCIDFGLLLNIARAYFSQLEFVHIMRYFIRGMSIAGFRHVDSWGFTFGMSIAGLRHVDSWGVSEQWATGGAYVKVICDITGFRNGANWIDRKANLIFFNSKNIIIHDVKQSVNISGYLNDEVATTWLNNDAVRKALHARPQAGSWDLCTSKLSYNHDAGSMIPLHVNLTTQGYRALIFSGDHDMCVPFTGSQAWTSSLGYKIVDEWRPWLSKGQVAGYLEGYTNKFTFLTVKGSGHTVPEYKPQEALDFYSRWLAGIKI